MVSQNCLNIDIFGIIPETPFRERESPVAFYSTITGYNKNLVPVLKFKISGGN
jgi:hypothetical protein